MQRISGRNKKTEKKKSTYPSHYEWKSRILRGLVSLTTHKTLTRVVILAPMKFSRILRVPVKTLNKPWAQWWNRTIRRYFVFFILSVKLRVNPCVNLMAHCLRKSRSTWVCGVSRTFHNKLSWKLINKFIIRIRAWWQTSASQSRCYWWRVSGYCQ